MIILAYVDVRPVLFIIGLPVFIGISIWACQKTSIQFNKVRMLTFSTVIYSSLFTFLLTEYGPFIGQTASREYWMNWNILSENSSGMNETEVVFKFVDYPNYFTGIYSDELADHLSHNGENVVKVVFEVTTDYGKVTGFHETEIAGLKSWKAESSYAGSSGVTNKSPWN